MEYLRVKTDEEIKETAGLAREIWTEHYISIIGAEQVAYMLDKFQSEDAIAEQIKNQGYVYYLINENNKAAGYFAIIQEDDALFLSKVYVIKNLRCKGIARKVIDFIKNLAFEKNLKKITLTVNKNNTGSMSAYEKLGFVNIGSIVQDIGGGFVMDDYKMELIL